jgi:flagellar biosynthesis GTPase FlhF
MHIRHYKAPDLNGALELVKRDLGPDALVLGTRLLGGRSAWFSLRTRRGVEVTAAQGGHMEDSEKGVAVQEDRCVDADRLERSSFLSLVKDRFYPRSKGVKRGKGAPFGWPLPSRLRGTTASEPFACTDNVGSLCRWLVKVGLHESFAVQMIEEAGDALSSNGPLDVHGAKNLLMSRLKERIPIGGGLDLSGTSLRVAFLGPAGVGKTTTVARLAVYWTFKEKKVSLISLDSHRIAGSQPLKAYGKILGVSVDIASTPEELKRLVNSRQDKDLILIDTPGGSFRDDTHLKRLKAFLDKVEPVDRHLLLSAPTKEEDLAATVEGYGQVAFDYLIFTKLDEACNGGTLVNELIRVQKPLSYLTVGQRVPEDIEVATRERVIGLLSKKGEGPAGTWS